MRSEVVADGGEHPWDAVRHRTGAEARALIVKTIDALN